MDATEIERLIRRDIREPGLLRVGPNDIARVIADAVNLLGLKLVGANPTHFNTREPLSSLTNVFPLPSGIHTFSGVKDMQVNAANVAGTADNGGLIQITTDAVHGWATGHIITHHDIGGTIEANGTFSITVIDTLNYTLDGSAFANAYTSGGKAFRETQDFTKITRRPIADSSGLAPEKYYTRGTNIVVDDPTFSNDIIIEYVKLPTTIAEIPERFHYGIVSFGVITLIIIPKFDTKDYPDRSQVNKNHKSLWGTCIESAEAFKTSTENNNLSDEKRVKRYHI